MPGFELLGSDELFSIQSLFEDNTFLMRHAGPISKYSPVRNLEEKFSKYIGSQSSLLTSSGSTAIKVALQSVGVKSDTYVITQPFTFIATFEAILELGAIPVVLPLDEYLGLSPIHLSAYLKDNYKRVSCILPVHMLGEACQIDKIIEISTHYSLPVIEDNCEALGGSYKGIMLGNYGSLGTYSFDYGKIITSGEGGLISGSSDLISKCFSYHDHGHTIYSKNRAQELPVVKGFNYRYSEVHAAILAVQFSKLEHILLSNKDRYHALSAHLAKYQRPCESYSLPSYDTYMFKLPSGLKVSTVVDIMSDYGITTKNIPSAMNWHCSHYWTHFDFIDFEDASSQAHSALSRYIAIPILLDKSIQFYNQLGYSIISSIQ